MLRKPLIFFSSKNKMFLLFFLPIFLSGWPCSVSSMWVCPLKLKILECYCLFIILYFIQIFKSVFIRCSKFQSCWYIFFISLNRWNLKSFSNPSLPNSSSVCTQLIFLCTSVHFFSQCRVLIDLLMCSKYWNYRIR